MIPDPFFSRRLPAFGDVYPVELAVRVRSRDPMTFANAFRDLGAAVDPNGRHVRADVVHRVAAPERDRNPRGAPRGSHRLLVGIFARTLGQLGAGAAAGLFGAIALDQFVVDEGDRILQGQGAVIVPIVILTITVVGVLAAVAPARHGLRIQPTEALREE